jgi:hypothetical protein
MSEYARLELREGRVYRTSDLARWSANPARLAQRLVREGTLRRISRGLYYAPIASKFGPAPVSDDVLLRAFLRADRFIISGPPRWNALGLGSTAMFAVTLVHNTQRTGEIVLDGRRFLLRRARFPKRPSLEWFVVDLIEHHVMAGVALSVLQQHLVASLRAGRWNRPRLRRSAKTYGERTTVAFVDECIAVATAGEAAPSPSDIESIVAAIDPLARHLHDLQREARALGIFVGDRELLTCPKCGLQEDVLAGGQLVTCYRIGGADTGLRFDESTSVEGQFTCPRCGGEARSD